MDLSFSREGLKRSSNRFSLNGTHQSDYHGRGRLLDASGYKFLSWIQFLKIGSFVEQALQQRYKIFMSV